jgi:hypothetical protein
MSGSVCMCAAHAATSVMSVAFGTSARRSLALPSPPHGYMYSPRFWHSCDSSVQCAR